MYSQSIGITHSSEDFSLVINQCISLIIAILTVPQNIPSQKLIWPDKKNTSLEEFKTKTSSKANRIKLDEKVLHITAQLILKI